MLSYNAFKIIREFISTKNETLLFLAAWLIIVGSGVAMGWAGWAKSRATECKGKCNLKIIIPLVKIRTSGYQTPKSFIVTTLPT